MKKEVVCIATKQFYNQDGELMTPSPEYGKIYEVYNAITVNNETYYHLTAFSENKYWFSGDFKDVTNLTQEINEALKAPVKKELVTSVGCERNIPASPYCKPCK